MAKRKSTIAPGQWVLTIVAIILLSLLLNIFPVFTLLAGALFGINYFVAEKRKKKRSNLKQVGILCGEYSSASLWLQVPWLPFARCLTEIKAAEILTRGMKTLWIWMLLWVLLLLVLTLMYWGASEVNSVLLGNRR